MRSSIVALPLAAALFLAGCGSSDAPASDSTAPTTETAQSEDAEETAAETETEAEEETAAETEEETETEGTAAFGEPIKVSDNVTVTISEPVEFTPSYPEIVMEEWDKFIKFDVVAKNTGDEPFEAFGVHTRATSGSREAEAVFDIENGIDMPTAVIQPGRELEFAIAFGAVSGEPFDLTIEDMMDFLGDAVTISTTVE